MNESDNETRDLIDRAREGDREVFEVLFDRHRNRLRRLIGVRMDCRLAARLEASDIVQETYLEAVRRFPRYLENPEMTFYLWLRWIAREKIIQEYRRHIGAEKRALDREIPLISRDSSLELARRLASERTTPSQRFALSELADQLEIALEELDASDRDVIIWRSLEQLTVEETAQLLGITKAAASKRYVRALQRLRNQLCQSGLL